MIGWLIFLAVLAALAAAPLGVCVLYDAAGFRVGIRIGPVKYWLDWNELVRDKPAENRRMKTKHTGKSKKKSAEEPPQGEQKPAPLQKEKLDEIWKTYKPFIEMAVDLLSDLRRKVRIQRLDMRLVLAGDDPADTAAFYGYAWMALGSLWPHLERLFVIRKRNITVQCDFAAAEILFSLRTDITITLGRLVVLAACYGKRLIQEYWKMKNTNKAVQTNE